MIRVAPFAAVYSLSATYVEVSAAHLLHCGPLAAYHDRRSERRTRPGHLNVSIVVMQCLFLFAGWGIARISKFLAKPDQNNLLSRNWAPNGGTTHD